jgi:thiamine pyrophosphate-dependent acetolactate synthase large subunit-like protein
MQFHECFATIAARRTNELVITSAGHTSEMWWEITHDTERTFYLEASMGMTSTLAAGLALGVQPTPVWVFTGDGGFCMNPGMLMVERQLNLPNLKHFLLSNRCYGSTSEVPVPGADATDYATVARGFGIERVYTFDSVDALTRDFEALVRPPGYTFIVLEVEPAGRRLEEPPIEGPEMKYRFGRQIERLAGIRVFDFALPQSSG